MTWTDGRWLSLDCETTGVDVETDRIVTVALVEVGGGEPGKITTLLVNPGVEIPEEVSAIHGVTTEKARAEGMPAEQAVRLVAMAVGEFVGRGPLVVANARFDLTLLDRECRRHGIDPPTLPPVVDPLVIDRHLDRFRSGSRRLGAVCEHYARVFDMPALRLSDDDAHGAEADAMAAVRLAWALCVRGEVTRRTRSAEEGRQLSTLRRAWDDVRCDLDRLHRFQVAVARDQAHGLRQHFERQGKTEAAASVRESWPLVPYEETATA
jgi:DNA polymerase-3 subunit epsilon